jgi:hypothetical protein
MAAAIALVMATNTLPIRAASTTLFDSDAITLSAG